MSAEERKATARRLFEEVWNEGDLDAVDRLYDADFVVHGLQAGVPPGREGFKQFVAMYRRAFPDTHFTIEDQIIEGDEVVTRWTVQGTHKGELMGIAPTGKRVEVAGITINRFVNGKTIEAWSNWDALGLLQQIGAAPRLG